VTLSDAWYAALASASPLPLRQTPAEQQALWEEHAPLAPMLLWKDANSASHALFGDEVLWLTPGIQIDGLSDPWSELRASLRSE